MTKQFEDSTATDYNKSGDDFFDNKEYDKALAEYDKAIKSNPKDAIAYKNRGVVFGCMEKTDKEIIEYLKAIELNDKFSEVYGYLGLLFYKKQQYDKALSYFTKAIESEPDNSSFYFNRGVLYFLKEEYDKAISDFTKTITLGDNLAEAYSKRGTSYANKREFDKAISDFTKAIDLNPNHRESYENRAKIYEITGKQEESQRDNHRSRRINKGKLNTEPKTIEELTKELNTLIGLDKVKKEVSQLVNFLKVQQMREDKGMAVQPLSRHLVFYGNPGTGKTTVARLLAQIYKSLGILTKPLCTVSAEVLRGLKVRLNYSRINESLSLFDGLR